MCLYLSSVELIKDAMVALMFDYKHRITLILNASKTYDRKVIEGIGNYLQTSKVDWDLYLEEDFLARYDNIDEWGAWMALSLILITLKFKRHY